ncbi:ComF family protein [Acidimicrobiaceae bacterium AH-315-P05]|nr:ComF family protein [Acidimicrobiaceae bacterium AH-315-P05]
MRPAASIRVQGAISAFGLAEYGDVARALVAEAKQPWGKTMLRWWAAGLAAASPDEIDVITWVPASRSGRKLRGHDQGQVLAREVARLLGRPARQAFRRADHQNQTGKSRYARLKGPNLETTAQASGLRVLVVDDVHTTGTTVWSAASLLRSTGAESVHVRVLTVVADVQDLADATSAANRI